ncbi:formate dehydrogenase subunit alpha [Candidatus Poribacteria bacterium]|nr:formate dehydrogenase subunit alpha [Candidatus Poribacteria bacterium]
MKTVTLTIDGRKVTLAKGSTVLDAIRAAGVYVPTLCNDDDLKPYGACRLCIVQIEGMRGLPTSCTTPANDGMVVHTETEEIRRIRRIIIELAIANHPSDCLVCDKSQMCELLNVARYVGVSADSAQRMRRGTLDLPVDSSNPAFDFDPNKCILCGKCVRICDEITGTCAIDFAYRGTKTLVSTFGAGPLALSACRKCGECVERCPTGALMPKHVMLPQREVETICPYCGVGCSIFLGVRNGSIVRARASNKNGINQEGLCVKGRYGLDFVGHPDRLTHPLIRKEGVPRGVGKGDPAKAFREASWDEALDYVAQKLGGIRERNGADAIGIVSSAKCTNEENYVLQKFARAAIGTNNVDHCARLCHASTVSAALAAFGSGAMSNSISDIDHADVLFVIGSNTTECHPIIGRRIKRAVKFHGAKLIVGDPRSIELCDMAAVHLNHFPGTDVALLNAMMREIIRQNLHDKKFIAERCEDFEPFRKSLERYTLESVSQVTGVDEEKIRHAAELFGKAKRGIVLYGMGITQHTTGTDNVKAVANLLMLTGNLGRRGTGFAPLRGQNNVQGSCDMGALPNVFPGYQATENLQARAKFEQAWGRKLSARPGLTLTEMFQAAHDGRLKAMYVMGENPMLSEPDAEHAKEALAMLEFLAVQDVFLTQTAQMADVVLPAASFAEKDGTFTNTERRVQLVRKAIDPPGEARTDWEITASISARLGYPMNYNSSSEIMEEIAKLTPIYGGIHHDRLEKGGLQWPCKSRKERGASILHKDQFTRGRGKFHVVHDIPPAELPSRSYPFVLTTGRILEHWHTGSMSHRSRVLEALASESSVEINPADASELGIEQGDLVSISSRRGKVETKARKTRRVNPGQAFMAFHWWDAPANLLTNPALDPVAKIPEFKVSSVRAILAVLERAAEDNAFLTALAENPAGALNAYDLTPEHRAALASGDVEALEKWVGPLEDRLKTWLKLRLKREKISEG